MTKCVVVPCQYHGAPRTVVNVPSC